MGVAPKVFKNIIMSYNYMKNPGYFISVFSHNDFRCNADSAVISWKTFINY